MNKEQIIMKIQTAIRPKKQSVPFKTQSCNLLVAVVELIPMCNPLGANGAAHDFNS